MVRQHCRLILDQGGKGVEPVCTEGSDRDFETDHKRAMAPSRHCPGVENPVDLGSWGVTATTIETSRLWWQGSERPDEWPSMNVEPTPESQVEIKISLAAEEKKCSIASIIDVNVYSSCTKLNLAFGNLTATEVEEAENSLVKEAQSGLTDQKNFKQVEKDLGLYSDEDGVIRFRGRIPEIVMEYKEKHPAFLPRGHHLTNLVIEQCHKRVHHGGLRDTNRIENTVLGDPGTAGSKAVCQEMCCM